MVAGASRPALPWLLSAVVVAAIVFALRQSFLGMLSQWQSSSTFSYGVLILPISLFLIWRERARLADLPSGPAWLALLLMMPMGAIWVLGVLLDVNVLHHFAAVLLVILAAWAVLGTGIARVIWFPLAYLLLMVPFGEFLVPTLMQWTADFAVLAVSLTGVPVFQDGFVFSLPSGDFEVIKACSGIRFLMATVAAGTVFAWIAYRSWAKRLAFVLACLVVPVIGNLLRAYFVVMLVHLSDGRLAGAHVLYGTILFGAILLAMFVIGARYADAPAPAPAGATAPALALAAEGAGGRVWLAAVLAGVAGALIAGTPDGLRARVEAAGPGELPGMPQALAGYTGPDAGPDDWQPRFHGAAWQGVARFRPVAGSGPVDLFIAAFDPAARQGEMTDSTQKLFDPRLWRRVGSSSTAGYLESVLRPAPGANTPPGASRIIWSWYVVDGEATDSRLSAKLLELQGLLAGRKPRQVLVGLSADFDAASAAARRDLQSFGLAFCASSDLPCPGALAARSAALD